MLLTITTTHSPATDLGYLLYKHPDRVQSFELNFGQVHVFYPEATPERCTAALLLDINPVGLVRGRGMSTFALEPYVNDRPYVASSFMSVAISQVYGTALSGICKTRPELAQTAIPLEAKITALPCRGGEAMLRKLFEPLGYAVTIERYLLDETFPAWGESAYYTVTLCHTIRLTDLLSHLYVLIPVLDDEKHYYVGSDEVEKLLRHGEGWLASHPAKELITTRYLKHQHSLKREALARLVEDTPRVDEESDEHDAEEAKIEERVSLHQQRLGAVLSVLKNSGAQRILDLGCGEGRLLSMLLQEPQFTSILGIDVSIHALEIASDKLRLDRLPPKQRERIQIVQGSLMYRDARLKGFDAAAVVEVIEHLDPPRLAAFERVLFEFAHPAMAIITTPNAEYNVMWENLPAGKLRHRDHRFEWTRAEFQTWATGMAERFGYQVRFLPIGPEDLQVGPPSQLAIFEVAAAENV
ncbi:MAG: 3' terminal RNA ribose 2'-O-methyltransferase Hen1 [Chloroflexota bacterium]|nr:3' terminal RNA ribose 2'-O-methyltransferase Hen1 [Chloroflexota bacterium]NOG62885.1 3' terminal RNA ribose 2'-O-methyltransferase Hen1 [Chloroflexota bacterium]GIK63542.1 MAG: 3' terminal RNA ribose 2'-O-methyltransferase Hen1 [Chloroflexota bacterium]